MKAVSLAVLSNELSRLDFHEISGASIFRIPVLLNTRYIGLAAIGDIASAGTSWSALKIHVRNVLKMHRLIDAAQRNKDDGFSLRCRIRLIHAVKAVSEIARGLRDLGKTVAERILCIYELVLSKSSSFLNASREILMFKASRGERRLL